jgi:hypothetical protein
MAVFFVFCIFSSVPAEGSVSGEIIERLIKQSGRVVDAADHVAARKALEKAAAKYGDEVWRLARLSPEAPVVVAARAETLVPLARRWGDDAVRVELKVPGCGEILARKLHPDSLSKIARDASGPEVRRFSALAAHCSPREIEAAVKVWQRGGARALKFLTPARIAASGFAGALLIAAIKAPTAFVGALESVLTGLLGPSLAIAGWVFVFYLLWLARRPLLWVARRLG